MTDWNTKIHEFDVDYEPPSQILLNGHSMEVEGYDMIGKEGWFISMYTPCTNCYNLFDDDVWCLHVYGEQPWNKKNRGWALVPCYYCQTMRVVSRQRR